MRINTDFIKLLKQYQKQGVLRLHMPSHKGKRRFGGVNNIAYDITELDFSDNLHFPTGIIARAEKSAAVTFGCKHLKFLTNGSTGGILIMLSLLADSDIIIERNSHLSVLNACGLFNVKPHFIQTPYSYGCVPATPEQVENSILQYPSARAVLITYPDYLGRCGDIVAIKKVCDKHNKLLLCDGAHSAHFAFGEGLPQSLGGVPDIYCMSAHKTLPALNQAAYLCINNEELLNSAVNAFNSLTTSSPSYPILASLDFAPRYMVKYAKEACSKLQSSVQQFKEQSQKYGYKFIDNQDFCKIAMQGGGKLFKNHLQYSKIYAEYCGDESTLFMLSVADGKNCASKLIKVLKEFDASKLVTGSFVFKPETTFEIPFCQVNKYPSQYVKLSQAVGKIAARETGLYPPGVPVILRGQAYTEQIVDVLTNSADTFGVVGKSVSVVDE